MSIIHIHNGNKDVWECELIVDNEKYVTVFFGKNSEIRCRDYVNLINVALKYGFKLGESFKNGRNTDQSSTS